ncbi:MAG: hypothetical protein U0174_22875 [Polyangiaceae bacterium]
MRFFSMVAFGAVALAACSDSGSSTSSSSSTSSGAPSSENRIGGIVIPNTLPLCTSATGGIFTASGGTTWSWSAAKNGGTHYAIKITKAPPGATTTTTLVDKLFPASDPTSAAAGESSKGTYYAITGAIVKDGTPLCTMDGANGVTP